MARSVSTLPKTTTKPASVSKSAPVVVADVAAAVVPVVATKEKKEKKEKKAPVTTGDVPVVAVAPTVAVEAGAASDSAVKAKKEKKAKSSDASAASDSVVKAKKEKKAKAAAADAAAPSDSAPVAADGAASAATTDNRLVANVRQVIDTLKALEDEARKLRAKCKSIQYASKKESNSSRKFLKSQKEAALAAGQESFQTAYQSLDSSVRALSKQMVTEMIAVKNHISKFSSLHSENVKAVRKSKKENRKRAPPAASIKPIRVHDKITTFMGVAAGTELSRHDVFKEIRTHIADKKCYVAGQGKKYICPDARLAPLFESVPESEREKITHFNMQTYLKEYFFKEVKEAKTA